jgi:hypothetical protein
VFAVRVGALDGRHPDAGARALRSIAAVTTPEARLFIDGGTPLRELVIPRPSTPRRSIAASRQASGSGPGSGPA